MAQSDSRRIPAHHIDTNSPEYRKFADDLEKSAVEYEQAVLELECLLPRATTNNAPRT